MAAKAQDGGQSEQGRKGSQFFLKLMLAVAAIVVAFVIWRMFF